MSDINSAQDIKVEGPYKPATKAPQTPCMGIKNETTGFEVNPNELAARTSTPWKKQTKNNEDSTVRSAYILYLPRELDKMISRLFQRDHKSLSEQLEEQKAKQKEEARQRTDRKLKWTESQTIGRLTAMRAILEVWYCDAVPTGQYNTRLRRALKPSGTSTTRSKCIT